MAARTKLLTFHGITLNGGVMRSQMGALVDALAPHVDLVHLDAPHVCPPETVDRLYASIGAERLPAPCLRWWDASDDGRTYHGWEETHALLRDALEQHAPAGVIGFSQGGIVAAAVAALSSAGALPPIRFAVLIAGRAPRSDVLKPYVEHPIAMPSLHIWGEKDRLTGPHADALVERFAAKDREVAKWPGSHKIPTEGPPADALVSFVARHK